MLDRLTIERLEAAADEGPILVALSGGGDSTALLHLLVEHVGAARLRAAVVDHALRDGSSDDARRALRTAQALGAPAEVLTLSWRRDANRAQQAAREGRYAALYDHARNRGARVIAVGHTAGDQAETVLIRAAAGSGWRGLAGMAELAPAPLWPEGRGLTLARPMLGLRRETLRAYLRAQSAPWIEDPANANPKFERVRVRERLASLETAGFDPTRLVNFAARLRAHVEMLDVKAGALIELAAHFGAAGDIWVDRPVWNAAEAEVRQRALAVLCAAVAGARSDPVASSLAEIDARLTSASFRGATHSGVQFDIDGKQLWILRDRGALLGRSGGGRGVAPLNLAQNAETVWDGRLALKAHEPGWSVAMDGADPILQRSVGTKRRISEAEGVASVRWLLRDRVRHALGQEINRAKPL